MFGLSEFLKPLLLSSLSVRTLRIPPSGPATLDAPPFRVSMLCDRKRKFPVPKMILLLVLHVVQAQKKFEPLFGETNKEKQRKK